MKQQQTGGGASEATISLPKGGGAIKGIGETFQANPFNGTVNHSVPLALSPGRQGFGPQLALEYSSGHGNGPFGLGWQLSLPRITRKTEKGLPRYDDSDVFVMSGAQDLVRCLQQVVDPDGGEPRWLAREPIERGEHRVYLYRPRVEGLFARIERWVHGDTGRVHWRTITKDNVTSVYGASPAACLSDPGDERRIYEWLLEETFDGVGNHMLFEYAADDVALYTGPDEVRRLPEVFEQGRVATQRYLRRVYYGNLPEPLVDAQGQPITYPGGTPVGPLRRGRRYAFEVVFDYGDWDSPTCLPHPEPLPEGQPELFGLDARTSSSGRLAPTRSDRFSHYRAGFDIRTLRRCRRVMMFHHFAELAAPTLVRSTDFSYRTDIGTQASLLGSVTVTGYDRDSAGEYRSASMPPVEFDYSTFEPAAQKYQSLKALGGQMPPMSLRAPHTALVDLFGDGLPDVLHTGSDGFRYWRNLGNGVLDRPRLLAQVPAGLTLESAGVGFGDMSGNGIADLLVNTGSLPGFFETTAEGAWQRFTPYETVPGFLPQDPNLRMLDLTGDGRADALLTRDQQFLWFECLGEKGFGPAQAVPRSHDLSQFPDVFFDDPSGRVRLADMTGDGLSDIVLVHEGRIDYWPNLGYGRFGPRVTMARAPRLGPSFDPRRLMFADLNGTGCADLVYVDHQRVHFWFNQSGNAWSDQQTIHGTPRTTDASAVEFADVYGTGTATLLWSHDAVDAGDGNYKALDFCGGVKPYVLVGVDNHMGSTTRVTHGTSTRHWLRDRDEGRPWLTTLPFPVQVVDKVESIDHISRTHQVTTYLYHHGHYDGREREFCGFGRVDQVDSASFEEFLRTETLDGDLPFTNDDPAFHAPPVETRSWFHTGAYLEHEGRDLSHGLKLEYYRLDDQATPLDDHDVETGETPFEAFRALRGARLRSETYARDGSAKAIHPYQVSESRHRVTSLQPRSDSHHAVYFSHSLETLSIQYERNPADPRVAHQMTLSVDAYGNPLKALSIAYGRRQADSALPSDADREQQARTFITFAESRYTQAIDDAHNKPDVHRGPMLCESLHHELTGFVPLIPGAPRFTHAEWIADDFARIDGAVSLAYEELADGATPQKRLIEHTRQRYRSDDLRSVLPPGQVEPLALPGESLKLAFTRGLIDGVYGDRVDSAALRDAGYVQEEGEDGWWIPSGRVFYSPQAGDSPEDERAYAQRHFFVAVRSVDAFGHTTTTLCDPCVMSPVEQVDALGNRSRAELDYRVLQPRLLTDPNGNRSAVAFDTLGLVAGTALMGKPGESVGDSLDEFQPNLSPSQLAAFLADPLAEAASLVGSVTTRIVYDLARFQREGQPVLAAVVARETHASEALPDGGLKVQVSLSYSDGAGREIQKKVPAEPGPLVEGGPVVDRRWIGSGWTVLDNKGHPVKKFEPFFDDAHDFRFDQRVGVSSSLFYDPLARVVATLHPNHGWEKVVFDPWGQATWDVNDTCLIEDPSEDPDVGVFFRRLSIADYLPSWFTQRQGGQLGEAEQQAAQKTAVHANTPSVVHADSLGRPFLTLAHNRFERDGVVTDETHASRVVLDIEGNPRQVQDALDRVVMRYRFDMLGRRLHQASMEAGERWALVDVAGQPALAWDSRGHRFRTVFDPLRRPRALFLQDNGATERLIGRTVYGEEASDAAERNLRGQVYQHFDQAGVATNEAFDFKGNLLVSHRQLAADYKTVLDWSGSPSLDGDVFTIRSTYDALNRPVVQTAPDGSQTRAQFNIAGLLEAVSVQANGATVPTPFVSDIGRDAKGQRTYILYGNGLRTECGYDPLTFRLQRCQTLRGSDRLQDLAYTYDPAGNITHIEDAAQQTAFFRNQVVTPSADFVYDAVYRLLAAEGREHIGQVSQPETSWNDAFRVNLPHPHDGQAMRRYVERYTYDAAGNFLQLNHQAANGNWTRQYRYEEASLLEPMQVSNRLSSVQIGGREAERFPCDAHGNITAMSHLSLMDWDFHDRLRRVDLGGGGTGYYVYDASGQRVRKVVEKNGGNLIEERITLGGFEVFRRRGAAGEVSLERQTLHVMDDQRRIALIETRTVGSEIEVPAQLTRYQLTNHLGSASLEADADGQIITYEEYYPYGGTSYQAGRSATEVSLKRYRYTGMERDEETGLSYHSARYYAPWLGRWVSCDPIGVNGGTNLYGYSGSDPIGMTDVGGHSPAKPEAVAEDTYRKELKGKWEKVGPVVDITPDKHVYANGVDAHVVVGQGKSAVNVIGDNKHSNAPGKSGPSKSYGKGAESLENAARQDHRQVVRNIRDARRANAVDPETAYYAIEGAKDGLVLKDIGISGYNTQVSAKTLRDTQASVTKFDQFADAAAHRQSLDIKRALSGSHSSARTPDIPHSGHPPHAPNAPGGKHAGKVIALAIALYVLMDTGDVYAAAQTANPLAETTDAVKSGSAGASNVVASLARDLYGLTVIGTAHLLVADQIFMKKPPFLYDARLASKALAEGRNPFCAQCHGPGGALDPNNNWNRARAFEIRFQALSSFK
ncbi:SpvB/TcaC N-terminal domain-containing protein [Ideonella sp. DXS29W]|uniref:SpvB/TcaC N-terminal domain-containing protein n=1 Tax=Ideonella lacteola TaxID=2984193 RepID=A0ABU9BKS7_9BURK